MASATSMRGKVALVTGGSSGIGRATALAFTQAGASVVIGSRRSEPGKATVALIKEEGGEAVFFRTDVSKAADVRALVNWAVETYGRLDYACNNAGTAAGTGEPVSTTTQADFDHQIAVNLKGVWLCLKYEITEMEKLGGGAIVNVSSVNGLNAAPFAAAYSAAKHGVIGLTKSAALEAVKSGIRINVICPGAIRTPMLEGTLAKQSPDNPRAAEERYVDHIPLGRFGRPKEIAEAIVWMCSDAASYMVGQVVVIDGGMISR